MFAFLFKMVSAMKRVYIDINGKTLKYYTSDNQDHTIQYGMVW